MRFPRARQRESRSPFEVAVDRIGDQTDPGDPQGLVDLVALIRPRRPVDTVVATARIEALTELVRNDPRRGDVLRRQLAILTLERRHRYFYADAGIVEAEGLLRGTLSRLSAKWLPPAPQKGYLIDLLQQVFHRPSDAVWIQGVAPEVWLGLWTALWPAGSQVGAQAVGSQTGSKVGAQVASQAVGSQTAGAQAVGSQAVGPRMAGAQAVEEQVVGPEAAMPASATELGPAAGPDPAASTVALRDAPIPTLRRAAARHWRRELAEAINILSTRLHAAATRNEVVRLHDDSDAELAVFDRLDALARLYRDAICSGDEAGCARVHPQLTAAIADSERELATWRKLLRRHGTTTSLSQQMLADGQMLARLRALVQLTAPLDQGDRAARALRLFRKLIEELARDRNVRDLWRRTNRMLALQVTEQAGMIGGHYVAITRSAWFRMIRAASGAGVVVAFMALIKQLITGLHLPPLWNALAISTNYAVGFVVVHLLHLAIATKQPAMTAALIASTVQSSPSGKRSLAKLASLIIAIVRTQFIAIVCNVATAIPTGMLLHWLAAQVLGPDWMPSAKAEHLLAEIDPIHSLALPHAAIAGVCLFVSGILAGYYNNLSAVTQVPERLERVSWLGWLGQERRRRIAHYVRDNLGALVGNATLGYLLGMAGFIGFLTGLPIDVRHVTLSASNLGLSLGSLGHPLASHEWVLILVGLLLIGSINLLVSFTLALWTAFSANGIRLRAGARLWSLVWRRVRRSPGKLLVP